MGRGGEDDALKPSDLTEAQREALKRQYRGVFWDRKTKRWRCQLGYQSKKIFLGYFDDAGEAARAYDQKLVELRGAGARTNFPITEYLDMMPTPTKRGGAGAAAVAAAAAAAAARDNDEAMDEDEDDDGEEIDQPAPTAAAAAGYGNETPSLDPGYGSATAAGRITGLLEPLGSGQAGRGYAGGSSTSPRQGLNHLPAIAPLSTDLPCEPHAAALAAQDFDMAGEDELTAAAQLAIEIRRSFDGSNFKWHQQQQQQFEGGHHQLAAAASSGSAGGSAGAAAAAGYDVHQSSQQQQQMGAYRNDTAAAAAAGYGGNASLYGTFGHHHHAGPHHYQQQQQQHFAGHHVRNGSTAGELYGGSQGWADPAAAAAAGGPYEGHLASYGSSHYPHSSGHYQQQQQQHHSHPGVASAHGAFSDSGGLAGQVHGEGYPMHHHQQQQQQHTSHHAAVAAAAAAAAAAAGYGHQGHHAAYEQQQARHYQHQHMYHQHHQRQQYHQANGDDQQMAAAGHMQQQQHCMGPHAHQQQQRGHYPLHHSHSYPGATSHENGMEGAAAAGYYGAAGTTGGYVSHAQAVAAHRASQQGQYAALQAQHHQQQHAGEGMVSAQGMYGSSSELQHYGGGLAVAQQQQYDARAAASNPAVAAADYRQRLSTYGLHGYASEPVEFRGAGVEGEGHPDYPGSHMQQYQQHMRQDGGDHAGATAMDAAGTNEHYNERYNERYNTHAAYDTEDPWMQSRGGAFGRDSAAGSDGGLAAEGAAGAGLPAVRTTRASGRTSRGASRALAVTAESDEYDVDDDEDYGSDSDTGRGRGRNSRRRSRTATAAAAVGHSSGEGVLRTKQRDGGDDERGHSYRGVFWDKKSRRWRCQLGHKNKKIFLGYFGVAEDAARAYDQKLVELHGVSAKTNFPIHNYLGRGGSQPGSARDTSGAAAAAAESPKAPGGPSDRADVPTRRRSSYAGDGSAKASHGQHSELSWGALGFPRSSRLSHDASEGAPRSTPRLSWAGMDTLSSWDQQDPDSQYAKRRKLLEGGAQLPTSPQDFGSLAGAMHASHQAVGGDDMLLSSLGRQGSGYRVVETPSVLTPSLTGRQSSTGQQGGSGAPSIDAAATTAGIFTGQQALSPAGGRSILALSRLASGEMGAVQALSGLHALSARSNSGTPGFAAAAAAGEPSRLPCGSSAVDAVLAAAGCAPAGAAATAAALAAGAGAGQQQSQASRLFDEAVHQYGGKVGGPDRGPSGISTVTGRVSDPNTTGTSSSTATPPSAITAGRQFGASRSPLGSNAQAALSRLNSSEVRAVQALSGIHNDPAPFQARHGMIGSADGSWGGFGHRQSPQAKQQQSPASITENVAKELICRAPVVSAIASSSIATVAAAAAIAAAAKGPAVSEGAAAGRTSADGSFSGLLGEIAAGLGEGRAQAGTPPDGLNPEQLTPGFSPLLASSNLPLPPPPPLQLDGQEQGGAAGAAAAAAGAAAASNAASGRASSAAGPAAQQSQVEVAPGDAFAAEAGWGNPGLEDLLMPKKRPSCSGSSGLIGLLGDIGQFKTEADAAAAAVVVQREEPAAVATAPASAAEPAEAAAAEAEQQQQEEAAAGDAAAVDPAATSARAPAVPKQPSPEPEAAATAAPAPATAATKAAGHAPVAPSPAAAAAELQATVLPAAATAALAAPPVAFMAEPMAVLP